jgi:hypothetical protein
MGKRTQTLDRGTVKKSVFSLLLARSLSLFKSPSCVTRVILCWSAKDLF